MKPEIDIDAILAPIPGKNPAGENLRYSPVYDEIKEARREDDTLDQGEWKHDIKKADWEKVITLSVDALTNKTKDLQIAAWLTESLTKTNGFEGFIVGLNIITCILKDCWEHLYPEIEDGDLEFRSGPLDFLNEKIPLYIKQVPITDIKETPGYSWLKWEESRSVGAEKEMCDSRGEVDKVKKKDRDEKIKNGMLSKEAFDSAAALSSKTSKNYDYYMSLQETLNQCMEAIKGFNVIADEKFGKGEDCPTLIELEKTFDSFKNMFMKSENIIKLLKEEKKRKEECESPPVEMEVKGETPTENAEVKGNQHGVSSAGVPGGTFHPANQFVDVESQEKLIWEDAVNKLENGGIKDALEHIYNVSCSVPSVREKNRYRLLMARLCLRDGRPDMARPITEELYALIDKLKLEDWESPTWIAEVQDTLYQCLTSGDATNEDAQRAKELFKKICIVDVTKAISY